MPATVFLIGFQLIPIVYNADVAFSNWSTGHNLTKEEAIQTIEETSLAQPANGAFYTMTPARDESGNLTLLLVEEGSGKAYAGNEEGLTPLPATDVTVANGAVTAAQGYDVLTGDELAGIDEQLARLVVPAGGNSFVRAEGLSTALELQPTLRYDPQTDTFTNIETGVVYSDNEKGAYADPQGQEIDQGWRTNIGFANFRDIFRNPLVRDPFLSTFVWTFAYALLSVVLTFFARAVPRDRAQRRRAALPRLHRSILILPYAIPAFLSLLVWRGLLNETSGSSTAILAGATCRGSSTRSGQGLLPARQPLARDPLHVPRLHGCAAVDPRGDDRGRARRRREPGVQVFRKITLPLLLVAVAPLLIASFAFNFNNFNTIYMLTEGGPYGENQSVAGATDILDELDYKVAFRRAAAATTASQPRSRSSSSSWSATISTIAFRGPRRWRSIA